MESLYLAIFNNHISNYYQDFIYFLGPGRLHFHGTKAGKRRRHFAQAWAMSGVPLK